MLNRSFKEALEFCSISVRKRMDELLPQDFCDSKLVEAMRYSALSGGKRVRPFLVMVSAQIFGISPLSALNAAVALEFIHVYSLIHDDLPAMDDDDIRRGVPSCHKKFDEATAILAGDALLTFAFEILVSPATHGNATIRCELVKTIARASGFRGMAGGQMIDLEKSGQKISNQELTKLHRLKTAELFMAAAEAGAILGEASDEERKELRYFADDLGLAFQIKDDISDQELAEVKDVQEQLNSLRNQAIARLKIFGARAALLVELMNFVVDAAQT
jgi:farnesyl diphosphate synthase